MGVAVLVAGAVVEALLDRGSFSPLRLDRPAAPGDAQCDCDHSAMAAAPHHGRSPSIQATSSGTPMRTAATAAVSAA
jgi:hypothetical protein